ncbi:MAG: dihydrolipoyllysine-residue succinyltransferase [Mariprofundaceae bacterium]|nr:dihydrolipoyllysine-residue succinyltransferase [Mariprofundaceae bacterium]
MTLEIKVPSLGESESEAILESWLKNVGDHIMVDDILAEIESDKVTMEITAVAEGTLIAVHKQAGEIVVPGEVIAVLAEGIEGRRKKAETSSLGVADVKTVKIAPAVDESVAEAVADVASFLDSDVSAVKGNQPERIEKRVPMSALRRRIARRLTQAQHSTATLTTFNEINMQTIMDLRKQQQDAFTKAHGVKLGFMSFFVRACAYAAQQVPAINAFIDGNDILYHNYMDIGIAVSTAKGVIVPVLRDAGCMDFAAIERGIATLADKARNKQLQPADLMGGTFSITNGGVFGSLLSTPILNPPQSAILGMHTIQKRAVVENDQIIIRPMMYVALSYDHRLIDGREAVQFLSAVKAFAEQPALGLFAQ